MAISETKGQGWKVIRTSPAVKAPILGDALISVRIKYFYSFMTFGPY